MLTRSVLQMEIRSGQVQPCVQPLSNESDADERDRYAVGQRSRLSLRLGHQIATSNREPVENVGWGVTPSDPKYEVQADTPEVIEPMTSQHYHGDLNYIDPRDDELFLNRFQKLKDQYEDPSLSTPSNSPRKVGQYEDSLSSTPTASPRKTNQYDDSMSSTATISPRRINLISVPQSHLQLTETIRCSSARPNASPVPGGRDLDNSPCPRDRESHISNSMTENNEERHDYPLYGSEDYESDKGVSLRPDYYDELEYNTQGVDMSQAYNNEDFDVTRTSLSYPYDERDDMPQQQGQTFPDPWSKLMSFTPDEQESSDQQDDSEPAVQSISAKASVCSDRSSRLDSHTYQTYTAGLLHSTDKSDDFQTLQRHFHNLEKITSMETKKSRPKSMDHALLELTDFTTEEELKQLSEELEDFKKTKKLPTRKQKPWTPHKDRGLMKREKSLGDIRAVYDKLEKTKNKPKSDQAVPSNESVKVKKILTHLETISAPDVDAPAVESKNYKAKIQDTKKGREISVVHARCVETDKITPHQSNRQDGSHRRRDCPGSSAASPRLPPVNTVSPRRVERAIYGTHIDETNNQYEIYVKEKKKEYKDDMGVASLHVRCMSAPYTKSSALSIPELGTDPSQTCSGNAAESIGFLTENPRQQVESFLEDHQYVDVSVSPKGGQREEGRSRSTAYSPLHEELTEDVGEKAPIMHSFREDGNYTSPQRSMGTNQPSREMIDQTEQQFYTGNDEWSRDGPDGYEMETSSLNNKSQMQPMEDVQFNVRNLRDLAKGNEFAQGKFAQRKPILEKYLADVWQRSARGELPQDIESDDQNMPETYGLIVHSHWDDKQQPVLETITTYPPLTSALTSDLDDDDSLSSRTSSTGTFIIKIGDNEERDMGDLSRDWVPSPTPYNRCQDDISTGRRQVGSRSPGHFYHDDCHPDDIPLNETYTKSKSQPNLSDSFKEQSLASQASKSQSNINRNKKFNDFALPRTISGNLKDVFKDYRDQKKFTRFESENGIQGSPTVNNNGSPKSLKSYSPVQEMQFINTIGNEWAQEDAKLSQKNSQPPYRKRIQTQIPRGSTHHRPAQPLRHRPPPEVPFHPKGKGQPRPGDTPTRPSATAFKHQTTDAKRSPPPPFTEKTRKRREEEEQYRKKRLEQIYEEERKRKIKQEEANLEARKHSDFYLPSQKSPIPADRFEDGVGDYGAPDERRRGFQIQGKAKALYNFSSQNPRELGFRKGDVVYLIRQIDKHWFEGERHGRRGIFPINYVEVVTSIEDANAAAQQAEGHGVAKFNFSGQTNVELNIRKGDHITLLRRVDDNWFEGRMGQKQGIFPVQYVEVKQEPSTPLVTPAPSVIATPMTGRGTPELLSPTSIDVPTPPPQPSPGAFSPKSSSMSHYPYSPKPFSHSLSHSSPKLDGGMNPSQFNSLPTGLNTVPGAQTNGHHESFQNVGLSASFSPSKSSSAIDNNLDYRPKVTDDDLATSSYKALYAYKPQNDDELELWEGDQVYVMEKCDDGWFVGTSIRTGMFGTFPGNYVQRVQ